MITATISIVILKKNLQPRAITLTTDSILGIDKVPIRYDSIAQVFFDKSDLMDVEMVDFTTDNPPKCRIKLNNGRTMAVFKDNIMTAKGNTSIFDFSRTLKTFMSEHS